MKCVITKEIEVDPLIQENLWLEIHYRKDMKQFLAQFMTGYNNGERYRTSCRAGGYGDTVDLAVAEAVKSLNNFNEHIDTP